MRKLFAKIHLWLSIPFGIIIAIVCLTGAILVFETEIQELCHPSHYFVKEVKGEGSRVPRDTWNLVGTSGDHPVSLNTP